MYVKMACISPSNAISVVSGRSMKKGDAEVNQRIKNVITIVSYPKIFTASSQVAN